MGLVVPKFESEAEEAKWWYDNRGKLSDEFEQAFKEGRLRRGGPRALCEQRGITMPKATDFSVRKDQSIMAVENIKTGNRVVFTTRVGDKDQSYDAVALNAPVLGHHPGLKCTSLLLNLAYLDEAGERHQVIAAPLLTVASTSEHLDTFAEHDAAQSHHFHKKTIAQQTGIVAEHRARLVSQERTTGWRPYKTLEELRDIADDLMEAGAE